MTAFAYYMNPELVGQLSALLWQMTWFGVQIAGLVFLAKLAGRYDRRLFPAATVAGLVAMTGVAVSAQVIAVDPVTAQVIVNDPCKFAEPYSPAWWMAGCFLY